MNSIFGRLAIFVIGWHCLLNSGMLEGAIRVHETSGNGGNGSGEASILVPWVNPGGGYFDMGSNWSIGVAPGVNDSSSFALNETYTVTWDLVTGDTVNDDMFVTAGDVTLLSHNSNSTGDVYTHTLNDTLVVGAGAFLDIGNGTDSHHVVVGGELLVDEATVKVTRGGSLTANGITNIGKSDHSSGFLNLQDTLFDSNGLLCIGVGDTAHGRVVAAGETIANLFIVDVGCGTSGRGRLEVIGDGTILNASHELDVGDTSRGFLEIRLGAVVNSRFAGVGYQTGGEGNVLVKHTGSRWNIEHDLDLGWLNSTVGRILIQEGGSINVGDDIRIGGFTEIPGCEIVVEDTGSSLIAADEIHVGNHDFLVVQNDGGVTTKNLTIHPNGTFRIAGSGLPSVEATSILNEGLMVCSAGGPDVFSDVMNYATIESTSFAQTWIYGDLENYGEAFVESGSWIRVFGDVTGDGVFSGAGQNQFDGIVDPGLDTGPERVHTMVITGNLSLSESSALQLDFAGGGPLDFDQLVVQGDVWLNGGTLSLDFLDGYLPSLGDEFVIMEIDGTLTGQFAHLPEGGLVLTTLNGQQMQITYQGGDGNDIAVYASPNIRPHFFSVTRGLRLSGLFEELWWADNQDFVIARNPSDIQAVTQVVFQDVAPTLSPTTMSVTLESSVFARSTVNQTIEFWNYSNSTWEILDTRASSRFGDSRVTVSATGVLTRFVSPTGAIRARITYRSAAARQQFTSSIDQFIWTFSE